MNTNFNAQGNHQEYEHYYRSVTKSSDESLHRVVENITSNITIPRLAQYIDALRSHWKKWTNITENISGDVEAVLTEAGEFLIDETDGDNILYEDDPDYNEYIILEDALTDNLATESTDADNKAFDAAAGLDDFDPNNDIFDFSENNPFGDPRSK